MTADGRHGALAAKREPEAPACGWGARAMAAQHAVRRSNSSAGRRPGWRGCGYLTGLSLGIALSLADVALEPFSRADSELMSGFAAQAREGRRTGRRGDIDGFGPRQNDGRRNDADGGRGNDERRDAAGRNDKNGDRRGDDDNAKNDRTDKTDNNPHREARPEDGPKRRGRQKAGDGEQEKALPRTVTEAYQRLVRPAKPAAIAADMANVTLGGTTTNEVLVVEKQPAALIERATKLGFTVRRSAPLPALDLSVIKLLPPPGMDERSARALLDAGAGNGGLAFNHIYRPYRPAHGEEQWLFGSPKQEPQDTCATGNCQARAAIRWQGDLQECARQARIGFIDTAVDVRHPVLAGRNISVGDFRRGGPPKNDLQHGTSTLAILAGAPRSPVVGLLPDAAYFVADIFFADEYGEAVADSVSLLQALDWMIQWNVRIINMSVAGPHDALMQKAIAKLSKKGIVFIAAAGNNGAGSPPLYPAGYKEVIAVSAVASDLRSYRHANRGPHIDLVAPGVGIWTALPDGAGGYQSGTSFAAPFVTAIVATLPEAARTRDKERLLTHLEYKDLGPTGRDTTYGRGLVIAPGRCAQDAGPGVAAAAAKAPSPSVWSTSATLAQPSPVRLPAASAASAFGFRD